MTKQNYKVHQYFGGCGALETKAKDERTEETNRNKSTNRRKETTKETRKLRKKFIPQEMKDE